jgi:hypothetical protein
LAKYWPDRPWPLLWYTNHLDAPCGETVKTGGGRNWGIMTREALKRVETPVVLLMLEDTWLVDRVDTDTLRFFAALLAKRKAQHIQLQSPPYDKSCFVGKFSMDNRLYVYTDDAPYKGCLQPGLWRADVLRGLLREDVLPGDFEVRVTERSRGMGGFLCVEEARFMRWVIFGQYIPGTATCWDNSPVSGGKWTEGARQYTEREGLEMDFSRDPVGGFT